MFAGKTRFVVTGIPPVLAKVQSFNVNDRILISGLIKTFHE